MAKKKREPTADTTRQPETTSTTSDAPLEFRCEFSRNMPLVVPLETLRREMPRGAFYTSDAETPIVQSEFRLTAPYYVGKNGEYQGMAVSLGSAFDMWPLGTTPVQLTEDRAREKVMKYFQGTALDVKITGITLAVLDQPQTVTEQKVTRSVNAFEARGTLYRMKEEGFFDKVFP